MPTIEIRDKFTEEVLETHTLDNPNIGSWLQDNVQKYEKRAQPPLTITVNDRVLVQSQWHTYPLLRNDLIVMYPEPKGLGTLAIIGKAILSAAASYILNSILAPNITQTETVPDGSSIYDINAQGNNARLNGIIPEIFGIHKYYPDHITAPWVEYIDDVQYKFMLLGCGVGEYLMIEENIGNTPFSTYGDDIDRTVFKPGEVVTDHPAHKHMYTSLEVGAVSGQAGFDLKLEITAPGVTMNPDFVYSAWGSNDDRLSAYYYSPHDNQGEGSYTSASFSYNINDVIEITKDSVTTIYRIVDILYGALKLTLADGSPPNLTHFDYLPLHITSTSNEAYVDWIGPFLATPAGETTTKSFVDLRYRGGIGKLGSTTNVTVETEIQWREEGTTTWYTQQVIRTAATNNELANSIEINYPSAIVPEIRMRRVSGNSTDVAVTDDCMWVGLRSELSETAASYSDMTVMALKIKGTNSLAQSAENKINTVQMRKLKRWVNGEWASITYINPMPVFIYMIESAGLDVSYLDLDDTEVKFNEWEAKGYRFSAVFDAATTLFEALEKVTTTANAKPALDNGVIEIIPDELQEGYTQIFNDYNTTSIVEQGTLYDPDEPDGIEVEYIDNETWKSSVVQCVLPGDLAVTPLQVRGFGMTTKTAAWRYGMRLRRAKRYLRKSYVIETEMEGLVAKLGKKCAVPNRRTQTGYITAISGSTLTSNVALVFGGGDHYIGIRKPNGELSGPTLCTRVDDYSVLLTDSLDFVPNVEGPEDPPLFNFGSSDDWNIPVIIKNIKPGIPDETGSIPITIEAIIDDVRVYADDENEPPVGLDTGGIKPPFDA